ncbi:phosphoric diester hydrolase [Cylindrospermopsis raciborskii S07]|uniref:Phosphoric diester hydrolase n=2 Tax=Cylindrospermopsis raciborskii TaxID=77022 RepID=A0A853MEB1_9CYAN|nr:hypothetical protein CRC_02544 [Cylindrospermopsis raciborskii CS-505]OHY34824.1 phosphoric diester hydrolase [Cylindrospermopsis raciborskii CS-508]PNJ98048.1 phosphoric diester hydrolase [Cylindrospermopsis raciborskii C03]PNJ98844.1 phosphoric diester hydrolase [Cylindrospermopsis raciborskii C04]PNJ99905.1 phosphoric diester hydrolase [Cylindrospermopsis raciborskii C07]PNK04955.1 phosphoric diester hydrolase [Cylindrospermopsis raciborskii S14]PNK07579.1 phosphoric diester hydrolase [
MPGLLPLPGYLGDDNLMILNLSHYGKFWVENFVFDIGTIGGTYIIIVSRCVKMFCW